MKKQPDKGKITALYERLSHDDERAGESVSIENQKRILEDYAQKNGFTNIRHFTDDGVRGTTFKRPGLDAMLEEIRAGNVATVIIKDQSRIGRDVVEVGLLKRTFDEYHVRFIAANDNLDTANGFDIMSIFRDVINEWYVADTSRKIKTVFKSRMEKGLRCSGSVSYGYLASKENKGEWVIDEEAAAVVRRIFHSVVAGESIASIARALRAEKIPIPSEHWKRIGAPVRAAKYTDPYAWSTTTISYILKRPEYTGRKVLGKTVCENYKTKSTRKTAPEEQYIFDGEIPAIVDEETWNTVQRLMGTKRRAPKRQTTPNRLTGLLYCADCGAKLTHRSSLVQGKYLDDAFVCSSYRQLSLHFFLQHGDSFLLLFDLDGSGTGLWLPLVNQLLHSLEVFLIHCLGLDELLGDELIQDTLIHRVGGAVFLPISVIGVTGILHPLSAFRMDSFSHKGAAAVLTAQEASIPQDTLIGSGPDISLFPFRQQYLSLLPNFSVYNRWEQDLVTKLLLGFREAEGLVDLVTLTFVANQRTDVTLILQNSAHHPPIPEVLFYDTVLGIWSVLIQKSQLRQRRGFPLLLIEHFGDRL